MDKLKTLVLLILILVGCSDNSEDLVRYKRIDDANLMAVYNKSYSKLVLDINLDYSKPNHLAIANATRVVDSLYNLVEQIPYGALKEEADATHKVIFESGMIYQLESEIVKVGKLYKTQGILLPELLFCEDVFVDGVLVPWSYALFYHVRVGDALLRLSMLRCQLLYLAQQCSEPLPRI